MSAYGFAISLGMPEGMQGREQAQWLYQWDHVRKCELDNLRREVERLRGEVEDLSIPEFYWESRSEADCIIEESEIGEYDDIGDVIPVRPLHELPTRYAVCLAVGVKVYDTLEEAEEAAEAAKGGA